MPVWVVVRLFCFFAAVGSIGLITGQDRGLGAAITTVLLGIIAADLVFGQFAVSAWNRGVRRSAMAQIIKGFLILVALCLIGLTWVHL